MSACLAALILVIALGRTWTSLSSAAGLPWQRGRLLLNHEAAPTPPGNGKRGKGSALPAPVEIIVQGSDAKLAWVQAVAGEFEAEYAGWKGRGVRVNVSLTSSKFRPELHPTIYTPSNLQWIETTQSAGDRLVSNVSRQCVPTLHVPLGLAMWRRRAEALGWPAADITLGSLVALADADQGGWKSVPGAPAGWADEVFKYGHGNPLASNSGRESLQATIYSVLGERKDPSSARLTYQDVWSDTTVAALEEIERAVYHLGFHDGTLLDSMVDKGPGYLDAAVSYEPMVVRTNVEHGEDMLRKYNDTLIFVFPADGTFWNSHPLCVLDEAEWATDPLQLEAAAEFSRFATAPAAMALAPLTGHRPFRGSYDGPGSLVTPQYGADPSRDEGSVPLLPEQDAEMVIEASRMWRETKKPAMVCMGIDASISMNLGTDMKEVKAAAAGLIANLTARDYVRLVTFDRQPSLLASGFVADIAGDLRRAVDGIHAVGLGSALYGTALGCIGFMLEQQYVWGPRSFNYDVVLMTDGNGDDYLEHKLKLDAVLDQLAGAGFDAAHVYGVLYETGLDSGFSRSFLEALAAQTSGAVYRADGSTIKDIYEEIALYF